MIRMVQGFPLHGLGNRENHETPSSPEESPGVRKQNMEREPFRLIYPIWPDLSHTWVFSVLDEFL